MAEIKWSNEQLQAINIENCNVIVSAGAGSGKTAVLTTRIKRKLLEGCKANELLVLTFTNAAAAEMKQRVVRKMKEDEKLAARSGEVDNAYITTFDSYALSVVKKYHYKLNLSSNISIIDGSVLNVYKRKVIDDIFNTLYSNHDEGFEKMLSDLTIKNDSSIKKALFNVSFKIDLLSSRDDYLVSYKDKYINEEVFNEYVNELNLNLKEKIQYISKNLTFLKEYVNDSQYEKYAQALSNLLISESYDDIRYNINVKMPLCRISEEAKQYKEEIASTITDLKALCVFTNIATAKDAYFTSSTYIEVIIKILQMYYKQIDEYKRKYEVFEFIDIAKMAIKLVRENDDIRYEISSSFKEILVDEYQDTNDLQEEFISYISNNNVYMVGDIKQSIYRFRNANPNIFKNKYDSYKTHNGGEKIDLLSNFRSNRQVLSCINEMFNKIMDNEIGSAMYKQEHQMKFGLLAYDEMAYEDKINFLTYNPKDSNKKKNEIEMFILLKDIQEKINKKVLVYDAELKIKRPCTYKDFAILISSSASFESIRQLLEYNHIPVCVLKNEEVGNGVIIPLLQSLLTLVSLDYKGEYNSTFKRCFYGLGRSFLCQMSDELLFDVITNKQYFNTDLYQSIHELSKSVDTLSLKELISLAIDKFEIIDKLILIGNINSNLTRIEYLLNVSESMQKLDMDLFDFVNYIDEIFKNNEKLEFAPTGINENKVKIMTIHKSKGLEFPIVYFINNYKRFNSDELKEKIIFNNKYGIITPYNIQGEGKNINYYLMKEQNNVDNISEQIRLLYVALTRAREQIVVISPQSENIITDSNSLSVVNNTIRKKYNSFKSIYDSIIYQFDAHKKVIDIESLSINDNYLLPLYVNYNELVKKVNDKITTTPNNIISNFTTSTHASKTINKVIDLNIKQVMEYGSHIHQLLESIDFKNPDYSKCSTDEEKLIKRFLSSVSIKNAKIYKEYEFSYINDGETINGIIDLMLEFDDHIDIIDYKLKNVDDEHYLKQLSTYKNYIQNKTNKNVFTYLYSIIEGKLSNVGGDV